MQNTTEIRLTAKQGKCYDFVCQYHSEHGVVPTLQLISDHMNLASLSSPYQIIKKLIDKGLLVRREGVKGYFMPDEPNGLTVAVEPAPKPKQTVKPEAVLDSDEFQYVRLCPGQAAEIGDVYIGLVDIETDKGVAALEVIAPAAMGVLRRDVHSEDGQPRGISQCELLLRCLEKTRDLLNVEIEMARKAATGSHFI